MQITSGDMPMLSDLQLVYMGHRNSTQLLKINTTKFQVEREPVYIKRNLKDCPKTLKELAFFSLVRSFTDYCSTVWDPHQKYNHDKLEMVQRRAARFVKGKYKRTESVTAMLNELGWHSLSKKREDAMQTYSVLQNY